MRPIRNILVAVNHPGADSLPAVTKAARLALACGAHLELFHAVKASVYADTPAAWEAAVLDIHESQRRQYLQRLERIAARLRLHGVQVSTAVEYDYPACDAIIRRAGVMGADLIVARRNAHAPRSSGHLHVTEWELLRHSPVPLLLVKRSRVYHHPTVLAAVDPCHAHSKSGQLDEAILSIAAQLTQILGGRLHAVHAYAPVVVGSAAAALSEPAASRLEAFASHEAKTHFEHLLAGYDIPAAHRHLVGSSPAAAIREIARDTHAALLVMGDVCRSGWKRFFIGNTAERVLDELTCDVLIVKPADFTSQIPRRSNGVRLLAKPS